MLIFDLFNFQYGSEFAILISQKLQELESAAPTPTHQKSEAKIVSVVSSTAEKKTMGPLKTSRAGEPQVKSSTTGNNSGAAGSSGSSRLLQSALQSSRSGGPSNSNNSAGRTNQSHANAPLQTSRGGDDRGQQKRSYDNNDRNFDQQGNKRSRDIRAEDVDPRNHINRRNVSMAPLAPDMMNPPPPSQGALNMGGAISGTVQYFEQMNKVAQMSGFKNAQEMIASQKEMMALMQGGGVPAPVVMPGMAFVPPQPPFPPQQQVFGMQPPYPGGPPPPAGFGGGFAPHHHHQQFGGHEGRGRGGRAGWGGRGDGGGRAYVGRGGGRGRGRGDCSAVPPVPAAAGASATGAPEGADAAAQDVTAADASGAAPAQADGFAPAADNFAAAGRGYGGRGRGGRGRGGDSSWNAAQPHFLGYPSYPPHAGGGRWNGRGGFGRGGGRFYQQGGEGGAPAATGTTTGHKTWVRTADLDSALVSGR